MPNEIDDIFSVKKKSKGVPLNTTLNKITKKQHKPTQSSSTNLISSISQNTITTATEKKKKKKEKNTSLTPKNEKDSNETKETGHGDVETKDQEQQPIVETVVFEDTKILPMKPKPLLKGEEDDGFADSRGKKSSRM